MPELPLRLGDVLFHWAAVILYVLATVALAWGVFFRKEKALVAAVAAAWVALIPHGVGLSLRWAAAGHGPYMSRYEVLSSNAWVAVLVFLASAWRVPGLRAAGLVVLPASFLMMTLGLFTDLSLRSLPPTLRSVWLVLHVLFAKLGAGAVLVALGASILYLVKERRPGRLETVPALDELDAHAYRFAGFGFLFWSVMIAAGAIWANDSWGRYWAWDPIELWSLITWLFFGLYLHLRRFFQWRGRRAAWTLASCFLMSAVTSFAVPFVATTLHGEYFR